MTDKTQKDIGKILTDILNESHPDLTDDQRQKAISDITDSLPESVVEMITSGEAGIQTIKASPQEIKKLLEGRTKRMKDGNDYEPFAVDVDVSDVDRSMNDHAKRISAAVTAYAGEWVEQSASAIDARFALTTACEALIKAAVSTEVSLSVISNYKTGKIREKPDFEALNDLADSLTQTIQEIVALARRKTLIHFNEMTAQVKELMPNLETEPTDNAGASDDSE